MRSEARVETENASRYLQQLCKHWSHKFEVTFTPDAGRIPFSEANVCTLSAAPDALRLALETADLETNARLQGVVIEHLKRFAFREDLGEVSWRAV